MCMVMSYYLQWELLIKSMHSLRLIFPKGGVVYNYSLEGEGLEIEASLYIMFLFTMLVHHIRTLTLCMR